MLGCGLPTHIKAIFDLIWLTITEDMQKHRGDTETLWKDCNVKKPDVSPEHVEGRGLEGPKSFTNGNARLEWNVTKRRKAWYLQLVFFAVDDDGRDLLIKEDKDRAEYGWDYRERNQPVVGHIARVDHPASTCQHKPHTHSRFVAYCPLQARSWINHLCL